MTNTKKCKCEKAHTMLDVLKVNDEKGIVENIQKWHKCYICSKFQISKWIRLHEMRCYYAHKNLERVGK
jgi:hypothetical protein